MCYLVVTATVMKVKKGMICELKSVLCSCSNGGKTSSSGSGCCLGRSGENSKVIEVSKTNMSL